MNELYNANLTPIIALKEKPDQRIVCSNPDRTSELLLTRKTGMALHEHITAIKAVVDRHANKFPATFVEKVGAMSYQLPPDRGIAYLNAKALQKTHAIQNQINSSHRRVIKQLMRQLESASVQVTENLKHMEFLEDQLAFLHISMARCGLDERGSGCCGKDKEKAFHEFTQDWQMHKREASGIVDERFD
jgi:hypothetical protein